MIIVVRKRKPKPVPVAPSEPEELPPTEVESDVLKALKDRYAKGEITKEEYEKLRSVLEKE